MREIVLAVQIWHNSYDTVLNKQGKFRSLLPLLPCTWALSVGEKRHLPPYPVTSRHLCNPSADQPVGHMIDWLLLAVGSSRPWPLTHTNAICIHQPKKLPMSKSVYYFTHRAGGQAKKFELILNSVSYHIPGFTGCLVLHSEVLHIVIARQLRSSDRKRLVLFPLNIKQSPNLGYKYSGIILTRSWNWFFLLLSLLFSLTVCLLYSNCL